MKYYDYDEPILGKPVVKDTDYGHYGIYHVYSKGKDLIIEIDDKDREQFTDDLEIALERGGYQSAEYDMFEPIFCNGFDFFNIDEIGALSEAPAFALTKYLPDWIAAVRREARILKAEWNKTRYESDYSFNEYETTFEDVDWEASLLWTAIDYYQIKSPLDYLKETGRCTFRLAE